MNLGHQATPPGSLCAALDCIETALQRVMPGMNYLEWVADEGEPAMEALRLVRQGNERSAMSDETYLPEDYIGAIQFALVGAASPETAIELITSLVADYPTDPAATRPTKLFVETVQALGGEYRLNQRVPA